VSPPVAHPSLPFWASSSSHLNLCRCPVFGEHYKYLLSLRDVRNDPVAQRVHEMLVYLRSDEYRITDLCIARAQRRKLLGNPPTSNDKYSMGDELTWEMILDNLDDDLIIVTRDHTYHDSQSLLEEELFERTKHHIILLTDKLSEALRALGETPSPQLIREEKEEPDGFQLTNRLCPRCGHQNLHRLDMQSPLGGELTLLAGC
jgi:hypothetical protein